MDTNDPRLMLTWSRRSSLGRFLPRHLALPNPIQPSFPFFSHPYLPTFPLPPFLLSLLNLPYVPTDFFLTCLSSFFFSYFLFFSTPFPLPLFLSFTPCLILPLASSYIFLFPAPYLLFHLSPGPLFSLSRFHSLRRNYTVQYFLHIVPPPKLFSFSLCPPVFDCLPSALLSCLHSFSPTFPPPFPFSFNTSSTAVPFFALSCSRHLSLSTPPLPTVNRPGPLPQVPSPPALVSFPFLSTPHLPAYCRPGPSSQHSLSLSIPSPPPRPAPPVRFARAQYEI